MGVAASLAQPTFGPPKSSRPTSVIEEPEQAAAFAQRPLKSYAGPKAQIEDAVVVRYHTIERRWLLDGFDRFGKKDALWSNGAREHLEECSRMLAGLAGAPEPAALAAKGMSLIGTGCDDPLVRVLTGTFMLDAPGSTSSALKQLNAGIEALKQRPEYAPCRLAVAAERLARYESGRNRSAQANALYATMMDAVVRAVSNPNMSGDEQRYLLAKLQPRLKDDLPLNIAESLAQRLLTTEGAPEWLRETAAGVVGIRKAWAVRGGGYTDSVSDKQWDGFREYLDAAKTHLERAHALAPDRPEAAASMITVAMAGRSSAGHDARYWFEQSVAAQFDWVDAYESYMWALRPRWVGSHRAMLAFGEECLETERFDTFVPAYMAQTARSLCADIGDYRTPWKDPAISKPTIRALRGLADARPAGPSRDFFLSWLAGAATLSSDIEEARRALDNLTGELSEERLEHVRTNPRDLRSDVLPLTDQKVGPRVREAASKATAGDYKAAVELLEGALALTRDGEPLHAALAHRLERTRLVGALSTREWIDLPIRNELPGWRTIWGKWSEFDDLIIGKADRGMMLLLAEPVGQDWELSFTIDVSNLSLQPNAAAGIIFGYEWRKNDARWMSVMLWPGTNVATVARGYTNDNPVEVNGISDEPAAVVVIHHPQKLTVRVNDKVVYDGAPPVGRNWEPGDVIGLAASSAVTSGGVDYSKFKLRRLEALAEVR